MHHADTQMVGEQWQEMQTVCLPCLEGRKWSGLLKELWRGMKVAFHIKAGSVSEDWERKWLYNAQDKGEEEDESPQRRMRKQCLSRRKMMRRHQLEVAAQGHV